MEKLQGLAGDDGGDDDGPPGSIRLRMVDSSLVRVHRHGARPLSHHRNWLKSRQFAGHGQLPHAGFKGWCIQRETLQSGFE